MAFSIQRAVSDGTMTLLPISIEYFDREEISVLFDGVPNARQWAWVGTTDKTLSFTPAVAGAVEVMVVRSTDLAQLRHQFSLGAQFTAESLDESLLQVLHIAQEATERQLGSEFFNDIDIHNYRLRNLGDPTLPQHAVTLAYYEAQATGTNADRLAAEAAKVAAQAAQAAAATSASAAGTSATAAGNSEVAAAASAAAATASENAAELAVVNAAAIYDTFDDRFLGAKLVPPILDNDGGVLLQGALYFLVGTGMQVWNGTTWEPTAVPTSAFVGKDTTTGAASIPAGSTAQRPASPVFGAQRANSTTGAMEWWNGTAWAPMGGGDGFRNKIINGKMEIAQRGTSGTSTQGYTLDRWLLLHAGTAPSWERVPGGMINGVYFSNLIEIGGASGNAAVTWVQRIEALNSADLCGKTVTFSAYVLHTNTGGPRDFIITTLRPNTVDNWSSGTSMGNSGNISVPPDTWARITWTTTLPASGPNLGLSFEIYTAALTASQSAYITGVQLEAGSIATPFEHRPYGTELSLCQRYYETVFGTIGTISDPGYYFSYRVSKRGYPTITWSSAPGTVTTLVSSAELWNGFSTAARQGITLIATSEL